MRTYCVAQGTQYSVVTYTGRKSKQEGKKKKNKLHLNQKFKPDIKALKKKKKEIAFKSEVET